MIHQVHQMGTKVVGVTRGGKVAIFSEEGAIYRQSIVETEVVDTLGAGDSFIAMFLTEYHLNRDLTQALQHADTSVHSAMAFRG